MAFAGFKKQINKANQYMNEKIGGAEGTKLDDDFVDMEKKTDCMVELVEDLQIKTKEYLQPNPTARAKMAAVKGISKLSGQAKAATYPQPEGVLGDCMSTFGRRLGEDSIFAQSLIETGESLKQMADAKYSLDDNVKQNFLEPLHHLSTKDLKEVMHHRKKLQGRRLDFDCKKRRQMKDDELRAAEDKFAESLHLAQMGMHNLLENDVEQVAELYSFVEALCEYHKQCGEILFSLKETLEEKKNESALRPKKEFQHELKLHLHDDVSGNNGITPVGKSPLPSPGGAMSSQANSPANSVVSGAGSHQGGKTPQQPCCQALYDFDPENPGELGFKEGEIIALVQQIDENWYEGTIHGKTGYFPTSYVNIVNPLP